jgi:hypothetical protein
MTVEYLGQTPPPLSPEVEALLAHERSIVERSEMVRARMLARARESLSTREAASIGPGTVRVRLRRLVYAAAAGLVLMASVAAAFYQMRNRSRPHREARPSQLVQPALAVPAAPDPSSALAPAPAAALPANDVATESLAGAPSAPGHKVIPSRKEEMRIEELELLDRARQADARGDYASVLAIAMSHGRRYPSGRLAEEREVLRVKALVGLGRRDEARELGAKFRRNFPRSVLLPKIDDMLARLR